MYLDLVIGDPVSAGVVIGTLTLILFSAAWHKFIEPNAFLAALAGYRVVPAALLDLAARLVPACEVLLGAALLIPQTREIALVGAATLLTLYGMAIALNLLRGRSYIDCGCGGAAQPVSWGLVIRNGVIAMAALAVSGPTTERALDWLDAVTLVLGTLTFFVAYLMADELLRQANRMARSQPPLHQGGEHTT